MLLNVDFFRSLLESMLRRCWGDAMRGCLRDDVRCGTASARYEFELN